MANRFYGVSMLFVASRLALRNPTRGKPTRHTPMPCGLISAQSGFSSDRSYTTFGLRLMNLAANLRGSLQIQRMGVVAQFFHRPQNAQGRFFVRAALWRLCMGGFGLPGFYDRSTTPCTVAS